MEGGKDTETGACLQAGEEILREKDERDGRQTVLVWKRPPNERRRSRGRHTVSGDGGEGRGARSSQKGCSTTTVSTGPEVQTWFLDSSLWPWLMTWPTCRFHHLGSGAG